MNEDHAIKKCQAGDLREFGYLYDKYISKIYDFVYYRIQHRETTEDLVSRIFIKTLENVKKYNRTRGSFSSWLYRIARNTVIDYYRTRKENMNIEDIWSLSGDDNLEHDVDNKRKLEDLRSYLRKFKKEHGEIIILRVWDELSYKEIAEIIGKNEANCKMIFRRAIAKLRQEVPSELFILALIILKSINIYNFEQ